MKSTRRIGMLLLLVFLLPALFFSVYEISSLNKDEEMIQEIYTKQLEAILFSVNQYSDDILNSWISKIDASLDEVNDLDTIPSTFNDLLNFNSSIAFMFVADTIVGVPKQTLFARYELADDVRDLVVAALKDSRDEVLKLESYKRSGFQKVGLLPYKWSDKKDLQCLFFITEHPNYGFQVVGLVVDPGTFIRDLVGPRLQVIAKDQFVLSAFKRDQTLPVYSTQTSDSTSVKAESLTKDFWLFPEYSLGIRTKGSTLQALIDERTFNNRILLISLDVILIIAGMLVFRNVRKEVQLAQNKADFVSNVSHEIRTPLALISMFAETLEMGRVNSEEKKREYYGIISKETHRLSGIVNKILNFSQTEANKKVLNLASLRIKNEISEILTTYDFHLRNKGFEYSQQGHDVIVKADREAFIEIVINLIDNAVKYSSETKRIEITSGSNADFGFVRVRDYGVGIKASDQKYIFDKFYRVSTGDLAKSTGTGLGLSLVKQLIDAQSGKIEVVSAPGAGSTFTVYFPLIRTAND